MDCKDVKQYLNDYVEGSLSTELVEPFEAHTLACKSCAGLLKGYLGMEAAIEAEKAVAPNPFAATRILQHLENAHGSQGRRPILLLRPALITLALFLALALGYLIGNHGVSRAPAKDGSNQEVELLKTNLFIADIMDEDLNMLSNQ